MHKMSWIVRTVFIGLLLLLLTACTPFAPAEEPTPVPTYTPQPTYTPVPTNTVEPTAIPTYTPLPTYTPVPTYTPEPTATPEPTEAVVPTATPEPTEVPPTSRPVTSAPAPTAVPPTQPPDPCAGVPASVSASVNPSCFQSGTYYNMSIWGFNPNEQIGFWLTDPNGNVVGTVETYNIGPSGGVDFSGLESFGMIPGLWYWVFEGTTSGHQSIVYFKIIP